MKTKVMMFAVLAFGIASGAWARPVEDWPYARLFSEAELIVIAQARTNQITRDEFPQTHQPEYYIGINTTLSILQVLKQPKEPLNTTNIVLLHFRYVTNISMVNNPFVRFRTAGRKVLRSERVLAPGERVPWNAVDSAPGKEVVFIAQPEYLLFLKRRKDGRYEPVCGQEDPALAVRQLAPAELRWFKKDDD